MSQCCNWGTVTSVSLALKPPFVLLWRNILISFCLRNGGKPMRCTKLNQIPASPWKISDQTFAPVFHLLEVNLFDPSAAVQIQQPRRMLQHRPLLLWGKVAKRNFCCLGKGRQNDTDLKIATTGHLLRLLRSTRQGLKQRFGCFCSHI